MPCDSWLGDRGRSVPFGGGKLSAVSLLPSEEVDGRPEGPYSRLHASDVSKAAGYYGGRRAGRRVVCSGLVLRERKILGSSVPARSFLDGIEGVWSSELAGTPQPSSA